MGDQEQRAVDITPTPAGFRAMAQIFREQVDQSEAKIEQVEQFRDRIENWQENWDEFADPEASVTQMIAFEMLFDQRSLLSDALDALESQERQRIAHIQEGIQELAKGGY